MGGEIRKVTYPISADSARITKNPKRMNITKAKIPEFLFPPIAIFISLQLSIGLPLTLPFRYNPLCGSG